MPSPKTRKKTKKNPTRKSLGYKIERTLRHPFRAVSKKINRMKSRRLQKHNSRRAKKLLRNTSKSRPTLLAGDIQSWYVPGKKPPIDFNDDIIRYANPRTSAILHTLKLRDNNDGMLGRRRSPIRLDDPWGQIISYEIKRLNEEA